MNDQDAGGARPLGQPDGGGGAPTPEPASAAGRLTRFYSSLTPIKKFIAAFLVVTGAIGTVGGAVTAINSMMTFVSNAQKANNPGQLARTPELGIEVWQKGQKQDLFSVPGAPGYNYSKVNLAPAPFELHFTKAFAEPGLKLVAWTDASIYGLQAGQPASSDGPNSVYVGGNGMADTDASSSRLVLTHEAFNYLQGDRVAPVSGEQAAAYFNTVAMQSDMTGHPFSDYKGKSLYLSIWVDRNSNEIIDLGEFDYIQLTF